jgi:hypothetical protein
VHRGKRIAFILIAWALLLGLTETSLQLFYRATVGKWLSEWWAIPIYETDPVRVYKVKGNLDFLHKTREYSVRYYTNAFGMRTDAQTRLPESPKPRDVFRVLSLGPSFAFGWGVNYEDSYIYQIAKALRVPGKRIELVNMGTPSQPVSYQLRWLKHSGGYQPDLIIQTVYGYNSGIESDDKLPEDGPWVKNGYLYSTRKMSLGLWLKKMRLYSATLFYGWQLYAKLSERATVDPQMVGDGREFYRKTETVQNGTKTNTLAQYRDYMNFAYASVSNEPQVVFLYVPFAYIVRPSDISRVAHHGITIDPFHERAQAASLTHMLCRNGINMIDTTNPLVEGDKTKRMYNLYDVHLTAEGNKVVASYAVPVIQKILDEDVSCSRPEQAAGARVLSPPAQ